MAISEQELTQAEERMAATREAGFAVSARYDRRTSRIVVRLSTGLELAFPPKLAVGLADATPADLADIEISPAGAADRVGRGFLRAFRHMMLSQRSHLARHHLAT